MKKLIKWLEEIEYLACEMYQKAAFIYSSDDDLKKFLEHNAQEEAWHYHIMKNAALFLSSKPDFVSAICVDNEINGKIFGQISAITHGLESKTLNRTELINKVVELELSEWNDVFLYAVNFLKDQSSQFKYPAASIQAHVKEIEQFLFSMEASAQTIQKIIELPSIWTENILIVDDEKMIADLIKSLLNRSGNIDIAHNGQDALRLMESKYYKLIISDIDMPVMDGISFFKEAVEKYPTLNSRFLFITGDISPKRKDFFDQNQMKYLKKPMDISVLREVAAKIILSM